MMRTTSRQKRSPALSQTFSSATELSEIIQCSDACVDLSGMDCPNLYDRQCFIFLTRHLARIFICAEIRATFLRAARGSGFLAEAMEPA